MRKEAGAGLPRKVRTAIASRGSRAQSLLFASSFFWAISLAAPPLSDRAESVVVSTFAGIQSAAMYGSAGDTVLIEDGIYEVAGGGIAVTVEGLVIRSRWGNRDAVVIAGRGMHADPHHGFWVAADRVTLADLTVRNVRYHCIQTDVDVDRLSVVNCVLQDAGEQIIKIPRGRSPPAAAGQAGRPAP